MRRLLKKIPVVGPLLKAAYRRWVKPAPAFPGSAAYWEERYRAGGDSGAGSRAALAAYKAKIVNVFIAENDISVVADFGCGDGCIAQLIDCQSYVGFDVSQEAISLCLRARSGTANTICKLMAEYAGERAQLTLSLDVVYHLVEDNVFEAYMALLFDSSDRFVIVHSSNTDEQPEVQHPHVRHRMFSRWIEVNRPQWQLLEVVPHRFPANHDQTRGSFADTYIYEKATSSIEEVPSA